MTPSPAFRRAAPRFPAAPSGTLNVGGGDLPPPLKRFREAREETAAGATLEPAVQIAFPPDRSELEVEDGDASTIVKAEGGALPLTWLVDGVPIASDPGRREAELPATRRGFLKLSVIDANGHADRVTIRLK